MSKLKFADSESYEDTDNGFVFEEDDEEEKANTVKTTNRLSAFFNDKSSSGLRKKAAIVFLIILYVVLYSAQGFVGFEKSYLPHRIIINVVGQNPTLALMLTIAAAVLVGIGILFLQREGLIDSELKLSQNKTHGSAYYADDEDMLGAVKYYPVAEPESIVLGRKTGISLEQAYIARNAISKEALEDAAVCVDKVLNLNVAVYGASGAGKSYSFARPNILTRIACGESFIVTDPSGELYETTAEVARKNGYNVKVLNLEKFNASNGWNPLDILMNADPTEVQIKTAILVHTILVNTADENAKTDVFFDQSEENLLKALILYVAVSPNFKGEEYERHLGTVYDLLTKLAAQEGILEEFNELPNNDPAVIPWRIFQGAGRLKPNFITGLTAKLEIFQTDLVKEVFSHSEIDLLAPGREKCGYYLITPVSHGKMKFLMSLFFSCAFEQLIDEAKENADLRLKVPTYFILDEFKAIGQINGFADKIANIRKHGISAAIIFQDLNQLQQQYKTTYKSILSNCDTHLVLKVNDTETAKELSERIGITTIETETLSYKKFRHTPIEPINPMEGIKTQDQRRMLMNPDEIIRYFKYDDRGRKAIVISSARPVYLIQTYDWHLHKLAKLAIQKEYQVRANDYIPEWQAEHNLTMDKPRSFETVDSFVEYSGKTKEAAYKPFPNQGQGNRGQRPIVDNSGIEGYDKEPPKAIDVAIKKGIVFDAVDKSDNLMEFELDLSGKKKK